MKQKNREKITRFIYYGIVGALFGVLVGIGYGIAVDNLFSPLIGFFAGFAVGSLVALFNQDTI